MKPHCFATYSDPRFTKVYYTRKPELERIRDAMEELVKEEMSEDNDAPRQVAAEATAPARDSFWSVFVDQFETQNELENEAIDD